MATPQTHVRHGALNPAQAAAFVRKLGGEVPDRTFNTARELYESILEAGINPDPFSGKSAPLLQNMQLHSLLNRKIQCHLVDYDGTISVSAPKLR